MGVKRAKPLQRTGKYAGQPYQESQAAYAKRFAKDVRTIKRWWKEGKPLDDPDAMGEFLSPRGRKSDTPTTAAVATVPFAEDKPRDQSNAEAWLADELAVKQLQVLDESFLEGEGLVPAMLRISKIERALAEKLAQELNKPGFNFREFSNRFQVWIGALKSMGKFEKDAPGILEKHKKQIDIGEVQEGVTKLLLDIVGRLALIKVRCRQSLAAMTDPQEIEDFVEHEISIALDPIRGCEWMPEEHRPAVVEEPPTPPLVNDTPPPACASGRSSKKPLRRRSSSAKS